MIDLRRHVMAVVAALFALAVGIAIGGGPLSYVPDRDEPSSTATDRPVAEEPSDDPAASGAEFANAFAAQSAVALYDGRLRGHPTAIVAMPGADPDLVEVMQVQVKAAGGGLTGVYEVGAGATDPANTSLVDTLGSQLMTELSTDFDDDRVDPAASTYVRLGQLISLAVSTPVKDGLRNRPVENAVRTTLATADLMSSPENARLAPLVLVVMAPHDSLDAGDLQVAAGIYRGLVLGLSDNPAGLVVLGDTGSGRSGLLAQLREDEELAAAVSTVDGSDTGLGQVTAMLALIRSLEGSVGSYGESGSDGAVPLT